MLKMNWLLACFLILLAGLLSITLFKGFFSSRSSPMPPLSNQFIPASEAASTEEISTLTDAAGAFVFSDLSRASHPVWIDLESLSQKLGRTVSDEIQLVINPGETLSTSVAGIGLSATYDEAGTTIHGFVWQDLDGNGQRTPDEPIMSGLKIVDPGIHIYFVPFDDTFLINNFYEQIDLPTCANANRIDPAFGTRSIISITAGDTRVEYFYDHWEDGYEATSTGQAQATTMHNFLDPSDNLILTTIGAGSANPANTPTIPGTPPATFSYDGRDRLVVIGEPVNFVRIAMAERIDNGIRSAAVTAMATEAGEVADWGNEFALVWGTDLGGAANNNDFDQVTPFIMAGFDNTEVWIDPDGLQGPLQSIPLPTPLNRGEVANPAMLTALAGPVLSTWTVTATNRIQIAMAANNCADFFGTRAMNLVPLSQWTNNYISPMPSFSQADCTLQAGQNVFTEYQIHNPNVGPLTVNYVGNGGPGTIAVPARGTTRFAAGFTQGGIRFFADQNFYVAGVVDRDFGNHDWGFSLIPENQLTSQAVLGWSEGSLMPVPGQRPDFLYSLAWLTPVTDTTIYVDLHGDGTPDDFDTNGDGTPDIGTANGVSVSALSLLRISDPISNSLRGATIYTLNYTERFALVFGQDPCLAPTGATAQDLGFTVRPLPVAAMIKTDELVEDADGDGQQTPGDTIEWTIVFNNSGRANMTNAVLTDVIDFLDDSAPGQCTVAPDGTGTGDCADWVPGSLTVASSLTSTVLYSVLYSETQDQADLTQTTDSNLTEAFVISWPTIEPSETITITFQTKLADPLPIALTNLANQSSLEADGVGPLDSVDPDDPGDPDTDTPVGQPYLQVVKYHLIDDFAETLQYNDIFSYTVVVTNTFPITTARAITAVDIIISDNLPPQLTYQPGSLVVTRQNQPPLSVPDPIQINGNVLVFTNTLDLAPDEPITYTFDVQITNTPSGNPVWNVVETDARNLHAQTQNPGTPGGFDNGAGTGDDGLDAQEPIIVPFVDLELDKDDGGIVAMAGSTIVYTLTYTNVGDLTALGVIITDTVPAHTAFDPNASLPTVWNCVPNGNAGSVCTTNIGALAPGAGAQVRFAVIVADPLPPGVPAIINEACITDDGSQGPDGTPANNCSDEQTPLSEDLRLGNRIWLDDNENGLLDGTETGPTGVIVELQFETTTNNFTAIATTTTTSGGFFQFADLVSGRYRVNLLPRNFLTSQDPLYDHISSPPIVDADNGVDNDNNGLADPQPATNGIRSTIIQLSPNTEVVGEADEDGNVPDDNSDLTLDVGLRPGSGTAIDLLYFRGAYLAGQVNLVWETAFEYDNFGFRLLRSTTDNLADAVEIAFVPGKGLGTQNGARYTYTDTTVVSRRAYTYWLVDVDLNAVETVHQPGVKILTDNSIFLPIITH